MKISIIWTWYVWLIQAIWLSKIGFDVTALDIFEDKIAQLNKWIPTIFENGLDELLKDVYKNINFTTDIEQIRWSEIVFLCVWTPQDDEWKTNLWYLEQATKDLKKVLVWSEIIVIKSTVPVWTNNKISNLLDWKNPVVSNPEFLREWLAIDDFFNPDRIVLWFKENEEQEVIEKVKKVYSYFSDKWADTVITNCQTAELIKYAANSFLATKITFINEVSRLADKTWANIKDISKAIWLDPRIWNKFLNAGIWYGGSCFPKDVKSLIHQYRENDLEWEIISGVDKVNSTQVEYFLDKILEKYDNNLQWKKFWIIWVAFKPDTDDLRESRSLIIIEKLIKAWALIKVFDYNQKALENFEKYSYSLSTWIRNFVPITICDSFENASNDIDSLIITIEDKKILDENLDNISLKDKIIFDWKNILEKDKMVNLGFDYVGVGV